MPIYQKYVAESMSGNLTQEQLIANVRTEFEKNLPGGHYLPLMIPFGDEVTNTMFTELNKLNAEYCCDPKEN